jgi:hypothetical protein
VKFIINSPFKYFFCLLTLFLLFFFSSVNKMRTSVIFAALALALTGKSKAEIELNAY